MHELYQPDTAPALHQVPTVGTALATTAPALTLYQVPVPGAVEVTLPGGQLAWARPVVEQLAPAPVVAARVSEPLPVWAKAACVVPLALSGAGLISAYALRVAVPALADLVAVLDGLWRFALVAAVVFGVIAYRVRARLTAAVAGAAAEAAARPAPEPIVINGTGGQGGRWMSKGGTGVHIGKLTINR